MKPRDLWMLVTTVHVEDELGWPRVRVVIHTAGSYLARAVRKREVRGTAKGRRWILSPLDASRVLRDLGAPGDLCDLFEALGPLEPGVTREEAVKARRKVVARLSAYLNGIYSSSGLI